MVELEAGPSRSKGKVSPMHIEVQCSVLKTDRLPRKIGESRRYVISAGTASKSACGWPRRCGRKTAISAWPTSWCAQLAASAL